MTELAPISEDTMKLVPAEPPGRSTRKARRFASEISALRERGYTFEAIRQALADAGVKVSNATVQREASRATRLQGEAAQVVLFSHQGRGGQTTPQPKGVFPPTQSQRPPGTPPASDLRSGKEIAEAFMNGSITNPLVRARHNAKEQT